MLNQILLTSSLLLHAWLVAVMWRKQVPEYYPIFFSYNAYAVIGTAARLLVSANPSWYFYVFWYSEIGFLFLGIAAIHEAFRSVFEGFYLLIWFRWAYFGGIGVVLIASILNSVFNRPLQVNPLYRIILDFGIPINCIQAAIFGLFYLCIKLLNVSFRKYPFAIVLGFGISAIGTLLPLVIRSEFGTKFKTFAVNAPTVAYYLSLAVWLSAFLRREPEEDERTLPLSPEQMADEVRQYTRILKGFFGKSNES